MAIKQIGKSLQALHSPLSDAYYQLKVLNGSARQQASIPTFQSKITEAGQPQLKPDKLEVLQINMGKLCNQTCSHCHVDAGPDRKEMITKALLEKCLEIIEAHAIPVVDITGGAPEMNPHFRWFVESCKKLGCHIINRCNLTIIVSNPKYHDLPEFFVEHEIQLICSLPHFNKLRTDAQRGNGVFEDSIKALKLLNEKGYGMAGKNLQLDLVHNPSGAFLPSDQSILELEFKRQLQRKYDITFNHLFVITNLPISRFLDYLIASDNYEEYMHLLVDAFNPGALNNLMCKNTLSVGWDGYLYDCDFNQMLDLKVNSKHNHIDNFNIVDLAQREIEVNQHCYGCTAGAGSSCGGALV